MAVAWESIKARLVSVLPAVVGPSVKVYDGAVVSGDAPAAYLTVAYQPSGAEESAGNFVHDVGPDGFTVVEQGVIECELGAVTGGTNIPSVFSTFDAISAYLADNQTLGGLLVPSSTVTASAVVLQEQTQSGATQRLLVAINYFTRLP